MIDDARRVQRLRTDFPDKGVARPIRRISFRYSAVTLPFFPTTSAFLIVEM